MTASCPQVIPQGARLVTVALVSGKEGTSPYSLKWFVDGVEKTIPPIWDATTKRWTFNYPFGETLSQHAYKSRVTDACGAVSENACSITLGEEKAAGISPMVGVAIAVAAIGAAYLLMRGK